MLWAITGGAGFLGLHLARRLLDDGEDVRTLDVAPLDDAELEAAVDEQRGDVRDAAAVRRLVDGRLRRSGEAPDRGGRSTRRRRVVRRVEDRRRSSLPRRGGRDDDHPAENLRRSGAA